MTEATVANFDSEVLSAEGPAAVYFHASWCKACKEMGPVVEAAESTYPATHFVSVDTDQAEEIVTQFGIRTIPSLAVFRDGKPAVQIRGPVSEEDFNERLTQALQEA